MAAGLAGLAAALPAIPLARAANLPGPASTLPADRPVSPRIVVVRPATIRQLAWELGQRDSATATLQRHCPIPVTARLLDRHSPPPLRQEARRAMQAPAGARLAIRHVVLVCGTETWSEAWNLYLPIRLDKAARAKLADGHTPFGRAAGERTFRRERLGSQDTGLPSGVVLENRALLRRRNDGAGFSYLVERYMQAALHPAHDAAPARNDTPPPPAPSP